MAHTAEQTVRSPAPSSPSGNCLAIAHYVNAALALQPPLTITGPLPRLDIHLPAAHLYGLGQLLPQLERVLQGLQGTKYWDVYVYIDSGLSDAHQLVHHTLLERSPGLATHQPSPLAQFLPSTIAAGEVGGSVPSTSAPAARLQQQHLQRQQLTRRRQWQAGAIALGGVSFVVGTAIAFTHESLRSRFAVTQLRRPLADSSAVTVVPPDQLEPAIAPQELPPLDPALAPAPLPESPSSDQSAAPDTTLWQPITSNNGLGAAANLLTVPPSAQVAVSLKAVGDIIPGTNFPDYRLPADPNYLFNSVKMFMGEVDILFGNFESTLTDSPYVAKDVSRGMTFAFRTPPAFAPVLQAAGFDILSVANNHSFDFGDAGFADTITHIEQAGMRAVGRQGEIVMLEANGYAIAFIGFSYWDDHNNMNNLTTAAELVRAAQAQADMVVVSVHGGAEGTDALRVRNQTEYFFSENRGNLVQFSRTMVDAGADLILGHGPHVPRAIELYQDKLIAYSLGNFLGYRTLSTVGPLGQSLILQVELNDTGDFLGGRIIPVALDDNGVPYIDNFFESVTLIRHLTAHDFPDTGLTIDQMGYLWKADAK
ncbi:MAG: CapA family protein [Cyanobacteria bacterium J06626_4]